MLCFFFPCSDENFVRVHFVRVFVSLDGRYSEDGAQQWVKDYTKDTKRIQAFDVYPPGN